MTQVRRRVSRKTTSRTAVRRPSILIELDPTISAGFLHGRFDVSLRGRVLSAAPVAEITLLADGERVAIARYGDDAAQPATTLPDGTPAFQRAFHFDIHGSFETADTERQVTIVALTDSGISHEQAFVLALAPGDDVPVRLLSGPVGDRPNFEDLNPPTILRVERAAVDADGTLLMQGWSVSLVELITVEVFADGERLSSARLGDARDDLAGAFPTYPNAGSGGFTLSIPTNLGNRDVASVWVQAIGRFGFCHEVAVPLERIGQEPAAPQLEPIYMYCDSISLAHDGLLALAGWAVCADGIVGVDIYVNDDLVGEADVGFERLDVGRQFPDISDASRAGFHFRRRVVQASSPDAVIRLVIFGGKGQERSEEFPISTILLAPARDGADEPAPTDRREFRFQLDAPQVDNGAATATVTSRLTIEGWVMEPSGIAAMDVALDGQRLGEVHYGLARQDVGAAFPDWEHSLRSGFAFHCPPRSLRNGTHEVRIEVTANNGNVLREIFTIEVKKADDQDDFGTIRRRVSRAETDAMRSLLADHVGTGSIPSFTLVLRPDGSVDRQRLSATLNAIRLQNFDDWRLIALAADGTTRDEIADALAEFGIAFTGRSEIIVPTDAAWRHPVPSHGAMIGFLCPGDELGADALMEFALACQLRPGADFVYADESRTNPSNQEREAFFKPDFSPDLLLSTNYIGHPWFATASLFDRIAVTPSSLAEHGEYDVVLRLTESASFVHHVPKVLCARGPDELDGDETAVRALQQAATRRGVQAEIVPETVPGAWRFKRALTARPKVSIIIPTCAAHGYIETCITTLRAKTTWPNFEIIAIDNIPDSKMAWKIWLQQRADKVVDMPRPFNWSQFNNAGAEVADGEYLLFLNDDIEICQDDWLDALMEHAQRPEVGVVGARLLYPDRKIQHAGMFLSNNGIGRHAFRFTDEHEPGYFGLAQTQRNTIAVTGACLLVRAELFQNLGRFDEAHEIVNNDLDFCLRVHQAGLRTVYTPHATLIHHELASRAGLKDVYDTSSFDSRWKTLFAAGDPYYNPNLSRNADDFRPDDEPPRSVHAGYPLFRVEDIQRILVVKLDHIGDFVTALPAMRALRDLFPAAKISVLAGPASRAFAQLEPAIDEFIEFAFFHSRSQLGERELTAEDFAALEARLKPQHFDLAIDLRKHPSTRDILRHTGARFLAGFDYLGRCPYLDIALEWDGDKGLLRKRAHVIDDLLTLVGHIERATKSDRDVIVQAIEPLPVPELPHQVQQLFAKPVVAIHPGTGNITKQWPETHFTALIDLLVERNGVNVMLVGGADEIAVADALIAGVQRPDAVASMAGQTSLAVLPRVLAACALFIGNDSGPKHIAAAIGVPTIGIHSGVVEAVEWGPVGRRAVAIQRNMSCSPCYLADAADCPRDLACLRGLEVTHVHNLAETLLVRSQSPGAKP